MFRTKLRKIVKWTALATAAALLLCWIASNRYGAIIRAGSWNISSERGAVSLVRTTVDKDWLFLVREVDHLPFSWSSEFYRYGGTSRLSWALTIPWWCPLLAASGVAFVAWKLDRTATLRARNDCCKKCGYDMRGLKVCPECGTA